MLIYIEVTSLLICEALHRIAQLHQALSIGCKMQNAKLDKADNLPSNLLVLRLLRILYS